MKDDLVTRLRAYVADDGLWTAALSPDDVREAADELDRLRDANISYAGDNANLLGRAMRAEAERDALQARIDGGILVGVERHGGMAMVRCNGLPVEWIGNRAIVLEPEDGKP